MLTQQAGNLPFTFVKGDDFPVSLSVTGIDLSEYTHIVEIHDNGSLVTSFAATYTAPDTLAFSISAAIGSALTKAASWRLVLVDSGNKRRTFLSGTITVTTQ